MTLGPMVASALCAVARLLTGVRAVWRGGPPEARQCIYFANHRSHLDFILIWASLPKALRGATRPVAGSDYWQNGALRRFLAGKVFHAVLVDRGIGRGDPLADLKAALAAGDSLILFPEGTRNQDEGLLPFKSGIYHLARAFPEVDVLPVWIENIGRALPKGSMLPVPLLCTLWFGQNLRCAETEAKPDFLDRARGALLALAPPVA